jgi:hypothetical protein
MSQLGDISFVQENVDLSRVVLCTATCEAEDTDTTTFQTSSDSTDTHISQDVGLRHIIQGPTFARIATAATSDSVWTKGHHLGSMPVSKFINYFFPAASSTPSPPETTTFAAVVSDTVKIETDMYDPFVRLPPSAQLHHVQ